MREKSCVNRNKPFIAAVGLPPFAMGERCDSTSGYEVFSSPSLPPLGPLFFFPRFGGFGLERWRIYGPYRRFRDSDVVF
ncbi:hypothetical protein NC651_018169 [Populus alba x Populus x berolinensis]|nr:hypothetical protein NC651_018169 [Populus alba x Populus x berolinensis]